MTASRRRLRFSSLREIMPDVNRLLAGHRTVGRWSLGQICDHLTTAIGYSLDGFPAPPAPWVLRKTIGAGVRQWILMTGRIPEGAKVPGFVPPDPTLDAPEQAQLLQKAIERLMTHEGALASHPLFGRLSRQQWERFHCVHCSHHLSFAIPQPTAATGTG